ncbi:MAG: hypothetical protein AAF492_01905, partial [Verrucomicrobiota bacterium]
MPITEENLNAMVTAAKAVTENWDKGSTTNKDKDGKDKKYSLLKSTSKGSASDEDFDITPEGQTCARIDGFCGNLKGRADELSDAVRRFKLDSYAGSQAIVNTLPMLATYAGEIRGRLDQLMKDQS